MRRGKTKTISFIIELDYVQVDGMTGRWGRTAAHRRKSTTFFEAHRKRWKERVVQIKSRDVEVLIESVCLCRICH